MDNKEPLYAVLLRDAIDRHNAMVAKHEVEVMDSLRLIMELKKHVSMVDCGHRKETAPKQTHLDFP